MTGVHLKSVREEERKQGEERRGSYYMPPHPFFHFCLLKAEIHFLFKCLPSLFFPSNCQIFKFLVSTRVTGFISNIHLWFTDLSLHCFQSTVNTSVPGRSSGNPSWFHQLEISSESPVKFPHSQQPAGDSRVGFFVVLHLISGVMAQMPALHACLPVC